MLVLGSDQRPDERGRDPGRTDTMMLAAVSPLGRGTALVSIPRDLWVPIPGHGEGRISTAYRAGELASRGAGMTTAKDAVGNALGVRVDRVVVLDMAGVRRAIDVLGGVEVEVPTAIVDERYPTDDYGVRTLRIQPGRQVLDGETAVAYARTRSQDSDFGRMGRQQQVAEAALQRLMSPHGLARVPALARVAWDSVQTDLSPLDVALLVPAPLSLPGDRIRHLVIAPDLVRSFTGAEGASLLEPTPRLRGAVRDFLLGG